MSRDYFRLRLPKFAVTVATLLALSTTLVLAQSGPVIYAIIDEQDARALADLFEERTGMEPSVLRGSTGEIIARVIAERDNPQADIVLGGPSTLHITLRDEGALEPHLRLPEVDLQAGTYDPQGYWTGFHVTALGIGVNVERFAARFPDAELPVTWEDMVDETYRGEIVVTDPVASSTAYLFVQVQLQRLGWDAGWNYLRQLEPLVGQFPSSGSAPAQLLGAGEYTLGVSYVHELANSIEAGMPLALVIPPDTGGAIGSVSIIAGGPNTEAAHEFVDFILGVEAQQLFTDRSLTTPLNPDVVLPAGAVAANSLELLDFDADLAAEQRDEVLQQWGELAR